MFALGEVRQYLKRNAFDFSFVCGGDKLCPVAGRNGIPLLHLARIQVAQLHSLPERNDPAEGCDDV